MRGVFLMLIAMAACGRPYDLRGPAPAGVLGCVLAHAEAAGYELVEGAVGAQSVTLVQPLEPRMPDELLPAAQEPGPVVRDLDPLRENRIVARVVRNQLRMTVVGIAEGGAEVAPAGSADAHARTMLAMCTTNPPILPDGSPLGTSPPSTDA